MIELLVSSVLAALLMLAIVAVLRTTNAQSKAAERMLSKHPPTTILADQIQRDFVNARHMEISPHRIRLFGYIAQDHRTREQTFRAAQVTYTIVFNRLGTMLVRQETHSGRIQRKRSRVDLLWFGAASIEVVPSGQPDEELEADEYAASPPGMSPIPARLSVAVYDRRGERVCSQEIFHHRIVD